MSLVSYRFQVETYGIFQQVSGRYKIDIFKYPKPDIQRLLPARVIMEPAAFMVYSIKTQYQRLSVKQLEQGNFSWFY